MPYSLPKVSSKMIHRQVGRMTALMGTKSKATRRSRKVHNIKSTLRKWQGREGRHGEEDDDDEIKDLAAVLWRQLSDDGLDCVGGGSESKTGNLSRCPHACRGVGLSHRRSGKGTRRKVSILGRTCRKMSKRTITNDTERDHWPTSVTGGYQSGSLSRQLDMLPPFAWRNGARSRGKDCRARARGFEVNLRQRQITSLAAG